jgi:hypothetical protein
MLAGDSCDAVNAESKQGRMRWGDATLLSFCLAALLPIATAKPSPPGGSAVGLELTLVSNLAESYADHGSGAAMDLFTFSPSCSATTAQPCNGTWYSLGDVARSSSASPGRAIVARAGGADPHALAAPVSMELNWNSSQHGKSLGTSGGVYTPVCPAGYAALGAVAIRHDIATPGEITPALFPSLRCVKATYLRAPRNEKLSLLWDSRPATFDTNCSVWNQPPQLCIPPNCPGPKTGTLLQLPMLGGQQSFAAPTAWWELNFAAR